MIAYAQRVTLVLVLVVAIFVLYADVRGRHWDLVPWDVGFLAFGLFVANRYLEHGQWRGR